MAAFTPVRSREDIEVVTLKHEIDRSLPDGE